MATPSTAPDTTTLTILHAESLALGQANDKRVSSLLGLIVIGFGGISTLATILITEHRNQVFLIAPFVLILLWFSVTRLLAELYAAAEYRHHYDVQIQSILAKTSDPGGYVSWQDAGASAATRSVSNIGLYAFAGISTIAALILCAIGSSPYLLTWQFLLLLGFWGASLGVVAWSAVDAFRLRVAIKKKLATLR